VTVIHSRLLPCWQPEETTELLRFCSILNGRGFETEYEYGETERHEPQFYLLKADPAQDCISCVSRISNDGRPWYVIEDGSGGLLAEGYNLGILLSDTAGFWRVLRGNLLATVAFIGELLTYDADAGERFGLILTSLALS
jgi:hypothetical protein